MENTGFRVLEPFYRKNSFDYEQVKRVGDVAVYRQFDSEGEYGYEVFEIRKRPESNIKGRITPAREAPPTSEEWGSNAFTVKTLEQADEKMLLIAENLYIRHQKT